MKVDTIPGTITIKYPVDNQWYSTPITSYYGVATDTLSGIDLTTLEYNYNNQGWIAFNDDRGSHDWDDANQIPHIEEGTATLQVRVRDNAGNLTILKIITIKVDTTTLPPQNIRSTTHPNQDKWYSNNNLSFSWEEPQNTSGIAGYSFILNKASIAVPDEIIDTTATGHFGAVGSDLESRIKYTLYLLFEFFISGYLLFYPNTRFTYRCRTYPKYLSYFLIA
jgi:hypothetical protein